MNLHFSVNVRFFSGRVRLVEIPVKRRPRTLTRKATYGERGLCHEEVPHLRCTLALQRLWGLISLLRLVPSQDGLGYLRNSLQVLIPVDYPRLKSTASLFHDTQKL